jgi:SAM-dependent methyltransferase
MNPRISYTLHVICNAALRVSHGRLRKLVDTLTSAEDEHWSRVILRRNCYQIIEGLQPQTLRALEISGNHFSRLCFKEYRAVHYPDYDVCTSSLAEEFDLIIAEQVFEHLLWPYRAGRNVYQMLSPGGHFLVSTPFLVRIHDYPTDCTRWTEMGLRFFLAECGFDLAKIRTFSWGNRACIQADFTEWARYRRKIHSLANEPQFPYHVWAVAQKDSV